MAKLIENDPDMAYLADGRSVPRKCVDALDKFESKWPGASFPMARTALAYEAVEAYKKYEAKKAKQSD